MNIFHDIFPTDHPPTGLRDPAQLLGWLHDRRGEPEVRNTVLRRLLVLASGGDARSDLAVELLILALWPGLCAVRNRLRPYRETETLDADLLSQLSIAIRRADPDSVARIAATLLRNVERDLRRAYQREARVSRHMDDYAAEQERHADDADPPEALLVPAQKTLGDDGVLLFAVHIAGFSQKQAAKCLGISHDAARKRCQRALRRLRNSADA